MVIVEIRKVCREADEVPKQVMGGRGLWLTLLSYLPQHPCWSKLSPWLTEAVNHPQLNPWRRPRHVDTGHVTLGDGRVTLPFPTQRWASTSVLGTRWLWKNCTLSRLHFVILEHTENIYRFLYNDLIVCMFLVSCGAPKSINQKCTFIHFFDRFTRPKNSGQYSG